MKGTPTQLTCRDALSCRCLDAHNLERRIDREVPSRLCVPRGETSGSMRRFFMRRRFYSGVPPE
jgi:hypothetical protein